jgi:hypothetical protein
MGLPQLLNVKRLPAIRPTETEAQRGQKGPTVCAPHTKSSTAVFEKLLSEISMRQKKPLARRLGLHFHRGELRRDDVCARSGFEIKGALGT